MIMLDGKPFTVIKNSHAHGPAGKVVIHRKSAIYPRNDLTLAISRIIRQGSCPAGYYEFLFCFIMIPTRAFTVNLYMRCRSH